jgi:hypothetical protein
MEVGVRQAVAAPGGMRRLSIHAESARVDVVLPATVAVGLLTPAIVDALAECPDFNPGQTAVRYRLSTLSGTALEASKTLNELRIRDGTTLALTHSSIEFVAPTSDDAAEAVSAVIAATERRWNRRAARLVGAVVASCWAGVGAAVLLRTAFDANGAHRAECVGIAATISFLALLAAVVACRMFSVGSAGLTLGFRGHLRGDSPCDRLRRNTVRNSGMVCDDVLGGRRRMRGRRRAAPRHRRGTRGNIVGDDRSFAPDFGHARAVVT